VRARTMVVEGPVQMKVVEVSVRKKMVEVPVRKKMVEVPGRTKVAYWVYRYQMNPVAPYLKMVDSCLRRVAD